MKAKFSPVTIARLLVDSLLEAVISPEGSVLTQTFGQYFKRLPEHIKAICHKKYHRWKENPSSLNFELKFVTIHGRLYGVHIDYNIHALCYVHGNTVSWFAVAPYDEYRRLQDNLRKQQKSQ